MEKSTAIERMVSFSVGDAIAKWDPLGLFSQSDYVTVEELYETYEEPIAQISGKIYPYDGWTQILHVLKKVFPPDLDKEQMIAMAKEIRMSILQSPQRYLELFCDSCSEEDRERCLQTVVNLYRIRDFIREHGAIEIPIPDAPFLADCLRYPESEIQGFLRIKKLFYQCLATEGAVGGKFLNDALAAEGVLFYLRFLDKSCSMDRAQWGQELFHAVKGLFGREFEGRVKAVIDREIKSQEKGVLSPAKQWPRDTKGAQAVYPEIPPYFSGRMRCSQEEKEAGLQTAAKLLRFCCDAFDCGPQAAAAKYADEEEDSFFKVCLLDFIQEPDVEKLEKKLRRRLAESDGSGGVFLHHRLIVEGILHLSDERVYASIHGITEPFCDTAKSLLGADYTKKAEQVMEQERQIWRKKCRRENPSPSVIPEFDNLRNLTREQCAQILGELPHTTLIYALKGAANLTGEYLLESLPKEKRQQVEADLDIAMLVRLMDVEKAQKDILEKAKQKNYLKEKENE